MLFSFGSFLPAPFFVGVLLVWVFVAKPGRSGGLSRWDWLTFAALAGGFVVSVALMCRRADYHYAEMRRARNEQVVAAHRAAARGDHTALDAARERKMLLALVPAILTVVGLGIAFWLVL